MDEKQQTVDDKTLEQLRIHFVKNNQDTYKKITQALDSGDIKLAHRLTHTLKSNAGQIKEAQLQEAAAAAEKSLADGENRLYNGQTGILEVELKSVLDKLAPLVTKADAKRNTEVAGIEKTHEIIGMLEQMLVNRNPECMRMLDDIRTIPGADELAHYVEEFEFKQAIEELSKLKERFGSETDGQM